jgi:hypothetical protein
VLAVAILVRGALLWAGAVQFGGDEAVVALMARHILRMGAHPFFFYGQAYWGSLAAWLAAAAYAVWGETILSFRLMQAGVYLGIVISTYLLALRIYSSRWIAGVAALLLAVPTVLVTVYTATSSGGYAEALLFGNLILLLALKSGLARRFWGHMFLLGFFAGVGWWTFPLIVVYIVPTAFLMVGQRGWEFQRLARSARSLRSAAGICLRRWAGEGGLLVAGGVLGSAPWWWYSVTHSWATVSSMLQPYSSTNSPWESMLHLALLGPSVVLGLRPPWSVQLLAWPLAPLVIGLALALGVYLIRRVRAWQDAAWSARLVLLGVVGMVLSAFWLSPNRVDPLGRHLLALAVPTAILMADFLHALNRVRWWLGRALALGLVVFQGWSMVQCATMVPPGITAQFTAPMQIDARDLRATMAFLNTHGETRGFTTFWLAYPLAFVSHEQLIFAARLPYQPMVEASSHDSEIYPPYTDLACQSPRLAYLTAQGPALDDRLRAGLAGLGVTFKEQQIGGVHIIYALSRRVTPDELGFGMVCGKP